MVTTKTVSVRLAVEADRLDETKRKLEELGVSIKGVTEGASTDKARREFEALERRIDPVAAASRRLAEDQQKLNAVIAANGPNADRAQQLLAQLEQRQKALSAATVQSTTSLAAGIRATQAAANAQDAAAVSTRRLNGFVQQSGYQISDAANQIATGANAWTVFGMQAGQLLGTLGPMGAALGAVVNVGGVVAGMMSKNAEQTSLFTDTLEMFEGRALESGRTLDTLTDKYRALSTEMQRLLRLTLESDIAKQSEKQAKDFKSAWDTIRITSIGGAQDVPAVLTALQQLGRDKDLLGFMEKLQDMNRAGAIKLLQDGEIRSLMDGNEQLRVLLARLADLDGTATDAQRALIGVAEAQREAAKTAYDLALASGQAAARLFWQEDDLDKKIAALKGGEKAMKSYAEEQVRAATYKKAYDDAIKAEMPILYAEETATRVATKAVEAHRLELKRADDQKAANAANRNAESQAERDAKAYRKVSEELDRGIAEQQRLAGVVGQSVEAQREANTQTKIAEALSKAHTTASTAEGKAIAGKVREQEKWRAAAADAAVLDPSKRQLAYAEKELSLMGQAEPLRQRALKSFQIQQEAAELAKSTTAANVAEWVRLQEQIADTQAIKAFQQEIQGTAKEMSRDVTQALLDPDSDWQDVGRTIGKRILLGFLENQFVMPIMTQVVGSVPGLFGINTPANQNGAGQNAAGQGVMGGYGQYAQAGQSLYNAATGTNTLGTAASSFATSGMGYSLGLSSNAVAPGTGIAAGYVDTIGATQISNGMTLTQSGQAVTSGLGAIGQAMPYGALGGMAGAYIGNAAGGNKVVGGLSGAAVGVGSMYAGTAAMGAMGMGAAATAAGASGMAGATAALAAVPVYGWVAAAVLAAVMAIAGTQKPSVGPNAAATMRVENGTLVRKDALADNGANTDSVVRVTDALMQAYNAMGAFGAKLPEGSGYAYIEGGSKVKIHGQGPTDINSLIKQLTASLQADGLVGRALGTDAVRNSTDLNQITKYLAVAKQIEDTTTALSGLDKSLGAVQKAAFKAAGEGLLPMLDELKTASEIGMRSEYMSAVTGQITNLLDHIANPRAYTETEMAVATLTGQLAAWKSVLEQVNPELAKTVDTIQEKGLERINKGVRDTFAANLNEATNKGFLNQLADVRKTWDAGATDALKAGVKPEDYVKLYDAQARRILDGLDDSQIDNVVSYFKDLDPVMAGLAESLRGTTTAAKEAKKALQANADSLTAWLNGQALGDNSSLSPVAKMAEAERQWDAALKKTRETGDISFATQASDALLSASKPVLVMGTEGYSQREAWVTSTLKNLGHELGLPGFATGGDHLGGLRIVGERGPELEWTGPSRIFSADQTRQILAGATAQAAPQVTVNVDMLPVVRAVGQSTAELKAEIRRLADKVEQLESEARKNGNLSMVA
ncbi:ABC transporter C-terminal domain-containing protein [Azospirillum brasilense]|uniref:Tail length tape measure protein n=1 Tax=Azospirillum brasilense TaxID=192 RepID=A0A235H9K7_AZOBR|nr:ABC transporter C-terminal domain-containing protein [Azospirillum brasilense]OYD82499.1 hypothetical protein CHT98_20070 [Azospirillum brasilense]